MLAVLPPNEVSANFYQPLQQCALSSQKREIIIINLCCERETPSGHTICNSGLPHERNCQRAIFPNCDSTHPHFTLSIEISSLMEEINERREGQMFFFLPSPSHAPAVKTTLLLSPFTLSIHLCWLVWNVLFRRWRMLDSRRLKQYFFFFVSCRN